MRKRIKVAQVVDSLDIGGAERVAVAIANNLNSTFYESVLIVTRRVGPLFVELKVPHLCLFGKGRYDLRRGLRFRNYIVNNKIDIVHAHGNTSVLFCVVFLVGLKSVRIIHHDHNSQLASRNSKIQSLFLRNISSWICVSRKIYDWVKNEAKYKRSLHYILNPVTISPSKSPRKKSRDNVFIHLANYREVKNHSFIIDLVTKMKTGDNFKIKCYGAVQNKDYYEGLRRRVLDNRLESIVQLNEQSTNIEKELKDADFGLLVSKNEGLPLALLEYLASGLPTIVTDVGDCSRIIGESGSGLVAKNGDELPNLISSFLNLKEIEYSNLSKNGIDFISKNHSREIFIKKIEKIYSEVLN